MMHREEVFYNGIGKRKTAVAKVFLQKGTGTIWINEQMLEDFFVYAPEECSRLKNLLDFVGLLGCYDVEAHVRGGGVSAQADAIFLSIAKAICKIDEKYRPLLSQSFLLYRDSRIKERRKYGLKKARKASQYSKR